MKVHQKINSQTDTYRKYVLLTKCMAVIDTHSVDIQISYLTNTQCVFSNICNCDSAHMMIIHYSVGRRPVVLSVL